MDPAAASPSLAASWLRSNALLLAAAGLAAFAFKSLFGADRGLALTLLVAAVAITFYASASAYGALLVGRVLRRILPEMPVENWVIWYGVIGAFSAFSVFMQGKAAPSDAPLHAAPIEEIIGTALVLFFIGAFFGVINGAIQAFILRWSARGLARWIAMSALGTALAFAVTLPAAGLWSTKGGFADALFTQIQIVANLMIVALVMLFPVSRLRPY
ncbi:MAG: hypothetical protein JO000_26960 [Alphaproteobacteria bacterium]|nr:hypothetical protein [Alphaproteobacteria bacterium]